MDKLQMELMVEMSEKEWKMPKSRTHDLTWGMESLISKSDSPTYY